VKRLERPGTWSFVTLLGYAIVAFFLIYPLYNVFRFAFLDKVTGALTVGGVGHYGRIAVVAGLAFCTLLGLTARRKA